MPGITKTEIITEQISIDLSLSVDQISCHSPAWAWVQTMKKGIVLIHWISYGIQKQTNTQTRYSPSFWHEQKTTRMSYNIIHLSMRLIYFSLLKLSHFNFQLRMNHVNKVFFFTFSFFLFFYISFWVFRKLKKKKMCYILINYFFLFMQLTTKNPCTDLSFKGFFISQNFYPRFILKTWCNYTLLWS